jgi:hypothetical protein
MKTFRILVIVLFILSAYTCNNKNNNKDATNKTAQKNEKTLAKNKTTPKDFKICESLVKNILLTSPRYIQLTKGLEKTVIKNGGQSFGISLEGSPNPKPDKAWGYSKTYDYTIYEVYTDRRLNTARFTFDPNNMQLYEYDAVADKLVPIEFDRNLLEKYKTLCK